MILIAPQIISVPHNYVVRVHRESFLRLQHAFTLPQVQVGKRWGTACLHCNPLHLEVVGTIEWKNIVAEDKVQCLHYKLIVSPVISSPLGEDMPDGSQAQLVVNGAVQGLIVNRHQKRRWGHLKILKNL